MATLLALVAAVVIPGFTPTAVEPHGATVLQGTYPGTVRPGYLFLPPGYVPTTRYPVLYLLHGLPGSPVEYLHGTTFAQDADAAIASGRVRPFIAVIPAAGPSPRYAGEWAGPLERALVAKVVPWADRTLPTIAAPADRVIAGLSAGGFGAVDIALRHPTVFGAVAAWSGYFSPLRDGPFRQATPATMAANDPTRLVRALAPTLRRLGTRFEISTGPAHSHWIAPAGSAAFAAELRSLGLPVTFRSVPAGSAEWSAQVEAGVTWAFPAR